MNTTTQDITDGVAIVAARVTIGILEGIPPNRILALLRGGIESSEAVGVKSISLEMCERITEVCMREVKGAPKFQQPTH